MSRLIATLLTFILASSAHAKPAYPVLFQGESCLFGFCYDVDVTVEEDGACVVDYPDYSVDCTWQYSRGSLQGEVVTADGDVWTGERISFSCFDGETDVGGLTGSMWVCAVL